MKAKDYLLRVAMAERKLKVLQARLRHYEDLGLTITSDTSAVGGHQAGTSRVELAAIGMADSDRALREQIARYSRITTEAQRLIDMIPQENFRRILTYRYLCGWSFQSISDEMRYKAEKSVYRAHGWALGKLQEIIDKEEETDGDEPDIHG